MPPECIMFIVLASLYDLPFLKNGRKSASDSQPATAAADCLSKSAAVRGQFGVCDWAPLVSVLTTSDYMPSHNYCNCSDISLY